MAAKKTVWTGVPFLDDGTKRTIALFEEGEVTATTVVDQIGTSKRVSSRLTHRSLKKACVVDFENEKQVRVSALSQ
jgi:hypothetical protein